MEYRELAQPNRRRPAVQLGITLGLAVLSLALLLWASGSNTPAIASPPAVVEATAINNNSVITVGVAAALSGPLPDLGWRQANAVQLAISQINAAGGIDIGGTTYALTLVPADSACDGTQAVAAANTLLDAGVVAVVGHTCSMASFSAQPIYNAAGVPMVSPSSSGIALTEQGYNTTFRVFPKDDAQAVLLATHFRQSLEMDRAAIVELSGAPWAASLTVAFSNTFTSLGGTVTSRRMVTTTDDYTATLTAIQPETPDVIYYANDDGNAAGLLSRVAHNLGMSDLVIGWDLHWSDEAALGDYAAAAGPAAEGDHAGIFARRAQDMPGYDGFNEDYQAAGFPNYGDAALEWGAFAYDAASIIIAAIDRADSADPSAIRDEIAATADYNGVVGAYEGFDAQGDVIPQWSWLTLYRNGEWVMAYPYRVFLPLVLSSSQ